MVQMILARRELKDGRPTAPVLDFLFFNGVGFQKLCWSTSKGGLPHRSRLHHLRPRDRRQLFPQHGPRKDHGIELRTY